MLIKINTLLISRLSPKLKVWHELVLCFKNFNFIMRVSCSWPKSSSASVFRSLYYLVYAPGEWTGRLVSSMEWYKDFSPNLHTLVCISKGVSGNSLRIQDLQLSVTYMVKWYQHYVLSRNWINLFQLLYISVHPTTVNSRFASFCQVI